MTPTEAETCARSIVYAAAEICGLREPTVKYFGPDQRLAFAAQVYACSGGISREPTIKAVLDAHLAWSQDTSNNDLWTILRRHTEIALRSYDEPKPTSRMIPDELLREIDAAMRAAETRLGEIGETIADNNLLTRLAAVTAKLENSAAAYVPDLITMEQVS